MADESVMPAKPKVTARTRRIVKTHAMVRPAAAPVAKPMVAARPVAKPIVMARPVAMPVARPVVAARPVAKPVVAAPRPGRWRCR